MAITLSKPNRFSKLFHRWKQEWNVNKTPTIYPTTPRVCCRTTCGMLFFKSVTNHKRHVWRNKVYICHTVRQTTLLSSLQKLLKMSAFCPHTRSKTLTSLVNCIINDAVVHTVPNVQQMLLHFINAVQLRLMHLLLDVTPFLVIGRIEVGAVCRPQIWRNESGCWILKKSHNIACLVCRCAVLLKDEEIARHVTHHPTGAYRSNSHYWSSQFTTR